MGYNFKRFEQYDPVDGIRTNRSNFEMKLRQSANSKNITAGIHLGQGPRYGMSPIPGQSHTDGDATQPCGLMQSELASGTHNFKNRLKVFGLVPVTLGTFSNISDKKVHYVWVVSDSSGRIALVFAGDFDGSSKYRHLNDIAAGLQPQVQQLYSTPVSFLDPLVQRFPLRNSAVLSDLNDYLSINAALNSSEVASLTVSGKEIPMQWSFGRVIAVGDATHSATPNFVKPDVTVSTNHYMGLPSFFNTRNFKNSVRQIILYNLKATGDLVREYHYLISPDPTIFQATFDQDNTIPNITAAIGAATTTVARIDAVAPVFSDVKNVLYHDKDSTTNSGYTAIFAAPNKAVMGIVQDWQRNHDGTLIQYVDPTNPVFVANTKQTQDPAGGLYKEDAIVKAACWHAWPTFDSATPLAKDSVAARDGITHVTLGEADTGILRKNTTYEISFAVYDKQLDVETNVGAPTKIRTDSDDFVRLSLFRDAYTGPNPQQKNGFAYESFLPLPLSFNSQAIPSNTPLNYLEYRIYYRQLGSFEWLPALFVDAGKYWGYPNHQVLWACEGAIAALPGGQPGGFNDYSALPKDLYFDVKTFKNRVFWCSNQNLCFSSLGKPFSYALRNSVPCPAGEFRGMIVHYFFGQAQQEGRIVIFGSKETYSGRFTGIPIESPVQVSPDNVGTFPLDGSDFTLETRTSITAFSGRAAVIADGELYWWGPTGIYYDSGVGVPEKISLDIEPEIFTFYDPNKVDQIHATYSEETKEIIWYYPEKNATDGKTKSLIYNVRHDQFYLGSFDGKVDWSQKVSIDKTSSNRDTNGTRTIVGVRLDDTQTVQRATFFDLRNRAGDYFPGRELLVKSVSQPTSSTLRLNLAAGFLPANLTAIQVGSTITIDQGKDYSNQSGVQNLIGQISAKGADYLDIVLPENLSPYFTGALTPDRFFPIWEFARNGFQFVYESEFWIPGGMDFWGAWRFLHLFFKLNLLPSRNLLPPNAGAQTIQIAYRTPISKEYVENTATFTDNSSGNFQVYTQLKTANQAAEGQAIQLKLSGIQNGTAWVLQYIAFDVNPMDKDNLQHYEG